jgi:hypothetical protein
MPRRSAPMRSSIGPAAKDDGDGGPPFRYIRQCRLLVACGHQFADNDVAGKITSRGREFGDGGDI